MRKQSVLAVLDIILGFMILHVGGDDPFQRRVRLQCFDRRAISGCDGTLVERFQPRSKGAGFNTPDTWMFLFTQKNPQEAEFLHECGGRLPDNTNFDPNVRTEIFIHGYLIGLCSTASYRELRDEVLLKGPYNVILIDWSWGSNGDSYASAQNEPVVGEQIAFMINNIMRQTGVSAGSFHLIGFSSGAHVAGYTGQNMPNLGRITGLDPAVRGKLGSPPSQRLDKNDAVLVDIIHTSATNCDLFGFGYPYPSGDADFYVNGGSYQASCISRSFSDAARGDFVSSISLIQPPLCSHLQSIEYYKVSIRPGNCQFIGVECPNYLIFKTGACRCGRNGANCRVMGMDFDKSYKDDGRNHTYYLDTELTCPYCDESMYNTYKRSTSTTTKGTRRPNININVNNGFF